MVWIQINKIVKKKIIRIVEQQAIQYLLQRLMKFIMIKLGFNKILLISILAIL